MIGSGDDYLLIMCICVMWDIFCACFTCQKAFSFGMQ